MSRQDFNHYPAQPYSTRLDAVDAALAVVGNSFQPAFNIATNGTQEFSVLRDNGDGYAGFRFRSTSTANSLPTLSIFGSAEEFTVAQNISTFRLDRFGIQIGAGGSSVNLSNSGIGITGNITMPSGSVLTTGTAGVGTLTINNDGNSRWVFNAGEFNVSGQIVPNANNVRQLGTTSNRWSTVFGVAGDFSGTLSSTGNVRGASIWFGGASTNNTKFYSNNTGFLQIYNAAETAGVALNVVGNSAVFRNLANNADAPITCSNLTASGLLDLRKGTTANILQFSSTAFLRTDTSQLSVFDTGLGRSNIALWRGGHLVLSSLASLAACSGADATGSTIDVSLSRASTTTWQMGDGGLNSNGNLSLNGINAVAATIANNATRASNLVSMSSVFNIGNGNSVLSLSYTGADMGRALSVSSASFTTGAMTIAQSTSANASNTNVSGLLVTGTFLHTDAGGATSIGNGGRFVATNTTASSGTLFGLDVSATTNAANVTGLRVTAATTSGTALAIDAIGSIQSTGTIGWSDVRMPRVVKTLQTQCFESSLSAWQETSRQEASATGARWSCLGATPIVRQTLPAAATDAATTQSLANSIRSLLINFGFAN